MTSLEKDVIFFAKVAINNNQIFLAIRRYIIVNIDAVIRITAKSYTMSGIFSFIIYLFVFLQQYHLYK